MPTRCSVAIPGVLNQVSFRGSIGCLAKITANNVTSGNESITNKRDSKMYNDGQCYFWLPTPFTVSVLTDVAAATINAVHTQLGLSPTNLQAGSQNPYILRLNDFDMGGANFTRDATPGMSSCGPILNFGYLTINEIALVVAFGGDTEGFPVFFEIDDPEDVCPLSESNETWENWGVFGNSHKPMMIGKKWYRSSAVGESGRMLHASEWVPSIQSLTVLTLPQFQAIQAANTTTP